MNTLSRRSLIGSYSLDLLRVYYSPQRMLRSLWLGLADPSRPDAGVQGFVRASVLLVAPGEALRPMADDTEGGADGSPPGVVLMPPSIPQRSFFLVVSLLRAEGLVTAFGTSGAPDASIRVYFGGHAVRTPAIASSNPGWGIEFWLPVTLPTCGNLIRLAVCDGEQVIAAAVLTFEEVAEEAEPDYRWGAWASLP
jgi:hypothetical protein